MPQAVLLRPYLAQHASRSEPRHLIPYSETNLENAFTCKHLYGLATENIAQHTTGIQLLRRSSSVDKFRQSSGQNHRTIIPLNA